jgi:hypothetical protein
VANDAIPYYEPGGRITGQATVAVVGKRFVMVSAARLSGPEPVTDAVDGGNIRIAPATAAGRVMGVASHDAAIGEKVAVICDPGTVVPVTAGAAIAFFEEVEVGANGTAVPLAAGVAVGYAVDDAANAADAQIKLY